MPIRPDLRPFYRGPEYREQRERILERAKNRCEQCGKPNHAAVITCSIRSHVPVMFWRKPTCSWWYRDDGHVFSLRMVKGTQLPERRIRVVLTMAHLDHNPVNTSDDNVKMLCQWCHLNYDKLHHRETRCKRKDAARPLLQGVA